jgi:hypothetical protein
MAVLGTLVHACSRFDKNVLHMSELGDVSLRRRTARLLRYLDRWILMGDVTIRVDCFERGELGTAFVDGYRLGYTCRADNAGG